MKLARLLMNPLGFMPEGPSVPVKEKLKLSDAILKGIPLVEETLKSYNGCAIGTGFLYKKGRYLGGEPNPHISVSNEFHVPLETVGRASLLHYDGMSREDVASWLRDLGY